MSGLRIIGICGPIGAGKTTIAERLSVRWGYNRIGFGDAIKREVLQHYPRTIAAIMALHRECSPFPTRELEARVAVYQTKPPGIRELIQEHGSFRRGQDPAYWVKLWTGRATGSRLLIVADDVRMANEAKIIEDLDGTLIRVERLGHAPGPNAHETETSLGPHSAFHFLNNGTVEELHALVDRFMAVQGATFLKLAWR